MSWGPLTSSAGGGVFVEDASPTVTGDVITANDAVLGGGVYVHSGAPLISDDTITGNHQGGGVLVTGATQARLVGNRVTDNEGIGVTADTAQQVELRDNLISGNGAGLLAGPVLRFSSVQDVITGNHGGTAVRAGGLYAGSASLDGDTIADNDGVALSVGTAMTVVNTVIDDENRAEPLQCSGNALPLFHHNLVHTAYPLLYPQSVCQLADVDGSAAAPHFVDAAHGNFTPAAGSPLVDAGVPDPSLPAADAAGDPRVVDGTHDGRAVVDIGAYERQ